MAAHDAPSAHPDEPHLINRTGWLRAAVLGANDGVVSVSAILVGVAAAGSDKETVVLAGLAGLVAGALSMAAGEYVSVSSQADLEQADIERERIELDRNPGGEERELAAIYEARGLTPETARRVARELTAANALDAHVRDELGLSEIVEARPFQAAWSSAATFSLAASAPLLAAVVAPAGSVVGAVAATTVVTLAASGALGAAAGRASLVRGAARVVLWGVAAMAATAGVGAAFGVAV